MSAVAFDTLKFVETLEKAGFERGHASAVAAAVRDAHDSAELATKTDIALLYAALDAQSNKITMRIGGLFIAILGAIEVINRVWPVQ